MMSRNLLLGKNDLHLIGRKRDIPNGGKKVMMIPVVNQVSVFFWNISIHEEFLRDNEFML